MHDHLESECQLRQIQCPHCETSLYARDYEVHTYILYKEYVIETFVIESSI